MIHTNGLKYLPTPPVLDKSLQGMLEQHIKGLSARQQEDTTLAIKLFSVFLHCTGQTLSYLSFNQDQTHIVRCFAGFIYHEMKYTPITSNKMVYKLRAALKGICEVNGLVMPEFPATKTTYETEDISYCRKEYAALEKDTKAYKLYEGWKAKTKSGEEVAWPLHDFYLRYGEELTDQLYDAVLTHSLKYSTKTVRAHADGFARLSETILDFCLTREDFEDAGSFTKINRFVEHLFAAQKLSVKASNRSMVSFYEQWKDRKVKLIKELFIKPGIWSEPSYELFAPLFKTSSTHANTNKAVDEQGNAFNNKLITHIPISYSDDQAIEALLESIDNDFSHVVSACQELRRETMARFHKRKNLAKVGKVKLGDAKGTYPGHPGFVDMRLPENQCATYEAIKYRKTNDVAGYLKTDKDFITEYAIIAPYTLYPFFYLLINEHSEITQSWLENWRLYNDNDKEYGFVQSGASYIATSYKFRRGALLAEQKIILNETSIQLVRDIITLTSDARKALKDQGNGDYKYMLIKARGFMAPGRVTNIINCNREEMRKSELGKKILEPSSITDTERAGSIFRNLSVSSFRASRAVLVYLKTKSTKAMSEALGHESYQPKLLSHYLPTPILRYFQDRWVRIFQNALVYEAMKESDYLFEAVDFSEKELDDFLRHHQLKPLPEYLAAGKISDLPLKCKTGSAGNSDIGIEAIIPVSVPVLSVMSTLVDLVENASESQRFTSVASQWYETSKFVLSHIKTSESYSRELVGALEEASKKPFPKDKLAEAVYVA
ncbi:hypothetical protein [Parashewanella tropica]|uniref:hypothetical protein n=1 Tax=Parashewanella tropica TaxID=2547970 RepID=UPI0010594111|nr:hypothetical protein [Parashewanella tropica]